ncbi:MAG: LuxR C-terminal-related transcriptional regulator, partial [Eubacterium sp.]|nr:LuxR C-terminal-related transcriptional regulator [Eubacterium sp.]
LAIHGGITYFPQEEVFIENLTEGEKKVLALIAAGTKRKEIAAQLFVSERTVSNHLQHIFEKLQVTSAVEAITKAIQLGYISPSISPHATDTDTPRP